MARMNVVFQEELLEEIRRLVPIRQRSEFIEGAVRQRLVILRQERAVREAFGAWSEEGRDSPESEIRQSRAEWGDRTGRDR